MGGYDRKNAIEVTGRSTITYTSSNETVNVVISGIQGNSYFGDTTVRYLNIPISSNGEFDKWDESNGYDYIYGNFYGPDAEEAVAIFEKNNLVGGLFATR